MSFITYDCSDKVCQRNADMVWIRETNALRKNDGVNIEYIKQVGRRRPCKTFLDQFGNESLKKGKV